MGMFIKKELQSDLKGKLKDYVFDVIGCCQDVHREQGPELTEYVYQDSLKIAFDQANIQHVKEFFYAKTKSSSNVKLLKRLVCMSVFNSGTICAVRARELAFYTTSPQ